VLLSPQVGSNIDPVTVADLDRVFTEQTFGEFLMLGDADGRYCIEAGQRDSGSDEYRIQWWNPAWPQMRATRELISLGQVREAFVGYLLGRDWSAGFDWVPWEPVKVRIPCESDFGRFPFCGQLDDDTLFMAFVTGERAEDQDRRWVAVLHQFDADGNHLRSESRIGGHDSIGIDVAGERADAELSRLVGPILPRVRQLGDVFIRPFEITLNGVLHGLVFDDTGTAAGVFHPRDIVFYFPWDTGNYDT
jgi:hypothetical protein